MTDAAIHLFFAVGTDESRRIDYEIWRAAEPGSRIVIASLRCVTEATVSARPSAVEPDIMVLERSGKQIQLKMVKSVSAGYYDHHPDERFPGCDLDVELDGVPVRLVELRARVAEQLDLFGPLS